MAVKQLIDVAVAEKVAALCTADAERVASRHVNPVARTAAARGRPDPNRRHVTRGDDRQLIKRRLRRG